MAEDAGLPWTLSMCVCVRPSGPELTGGSAHKRPLENPPVSMEWFIKLYSGRVAE